MEKQTAEISNDMIITKFRLIAQFEDGRLCLLHLKDEIVTAIAESQMGIVMPPIIEDFHPIYNEWARKIQETEEQENPVEETEENA